MTLTINQQKNLVGLAIILWMASYVAIPLVTQDYFRKRQEIALEQDVAVKLALPSTSVHAFIPKETGRYGLCLIKIANTRASHPFASPPEYTDPEYITESFQFYETAPPFQRVKPYLPVAFRPNRVYHTPVGEVYYDSRTGYGVLKRNLGRG